jgi:peptidoglycan-associated lipoprotein
MKIFSLFSIFLFLGLSLTKAQPVNRPTYAIMVKTAEEQLAKKDYYRALEWYEKAYEESRDVELAIIIGDLNYQLRDYMQAERWYGRALRPVRRGKSLSEAAEAKRFEYARSLKMVEKYDEAIEQFDQYLGKSKDEIKRELAELEKIGCEFARVAKIQDGLTITNAGKEVNTKNSEYSAFLTNDNTEMYFASLVSNEVVEIDEKNTDYHSKIFKSSRDDKGWAKPVVLDENINRQGFFNANVTLSPDGKRMFFNRLLLEGNDIKESKIYLSERRDDTWSPANELNGGNGDFIAKSPSVGELFGREVLFFVSDMEGGFGGYDIYYATYKGGGQYGDPVNLGPKINTVGNEETPFYRDGTLYFSSTGHPGIGGYDIFMSTWNGTLWSKPANLGKGYNSSVDDLYFMLDKEGYHGFLVSNRPAEGARSLKGKTCCNDIYNVSLKKIIADLLATTYDSDTKEPLNGATVELFELRDDVPKSLGTKTNANGNVFEFPLELDIAYRIIASADNYNNDTLDFNTIGLFDSKTYQERLSLKPGRKFIRIKKEEPFVLENIFYDFDDDKILRDAEVDLEFIRGLMVSYPDMVIELSSHTDSRGSDTYNQDLSQRRAESARRWLVSKGIERRRIEAKGYGESLPKTVDARIAARNPFLKAGVTLIDSVIFSFLPDTVKFEAAHRINRRTEFKILSGPTSIVIEEEQLIQIGNKKVDGSQPPKQPEPKGNEKKPEPRRGRGGGNSPGGDSLKSPEPIGSKLLKDTIVIDKLSSLYGKKSLKGLPIMQFEQRMVDFGKVKKGETREHTYVFTNLGDVPLEIDIATSCDCTSLDYSTSSVPPGGKGKIKIVFDSSSKSVKEFIDVDIFLKNIDPAVNAPIFERVKYTFDIEK